MIYGGRSAKRKRKPVGRQMTAGTLRPRSLREESVAEAQGVLMHMAGAMKTLVWE